MERRSSLVETRPAETGISTSMLPIPKGAMREFPAYEYETGTRADQEWRTYFDFLYPSEIDFQRIMNRRVRQQLEKNGDNASNERKIDHPALLPNPKAQA